MLPVVSYAFLLYALWSRYMRSSVLDNLVQDYVRTARAKGASERRVIWGHVFRNSLVVDRHPARPVAARRWSPARSSSRSSSTTRAWGWRSTRPRLTLTTRSLLGFTVLATMATILGNLLADVGYAVLDPRVRY